ncbi:hypothetical protein PQR62_17165 [Herbaspirillum lusitanum]|uniref:Uncharacterized protein n=1 Tax=Herbaspirillum lusitanum TaxID=213312 RepID=A0ABW9ADB9_9BURK
MNFFIGALNVTASSVGKIYGSCNTTVKRLDHGNVTMAQMPWRMRSTFGPVEDLLVALETTGDINADKDGPVYRAPSSHAWFDMAGAIVGFAEFYDAHARISGREMPTF